MCRSGIIPRAYHSYYESLAVGKGMKGRLPEQDVDEEIQMTMNRHFTCLYRVYKTYIIAIYA